MTLPTGKSETYEAVLHEIIDLAQAEVGPVDLTADSALQGQGLDSLKLLSLLFKIERRYGIVLEEEDGDDLRTVGDLAALAVRRIQERA
jgi:acyl carrier protein